MGARSPCPHSISRRHDHLSETAACVTVLSLLWLQFATGFDAGVFRHRLDACVCVVSGGAVWFTDGEGVPWDEGDPCGACPRRARRHRGGRHRRGCGSSAPAGSARPPLALPPQPAAGPRRARLAVRGRAEAHRADPRHGAGMGGLSGQRRRCCALHLCGWNGAWQYSRGRLGGGVCRFVRVLVWLADSPWLSESLSGAEGELLEIVPGGLCTGTSSRGLRILEGAT